MNIKKMFAKYKIDISNFFSLLLRCFFMYWFYCVFSLGVVILNEPPTAPENIRQLVLALFWWINPRTAFLLLLFVAIWQLYRIADAIHEEGKQELLDIRLGRTSSGGGKQDKIEYEE